MNNFILSERPLVTLSLGIYFVYISHQGYNIIIINDKDDYRQLLYLPLGLFGLIMILYSIYLFYRS